MRVRITLAGRQYEVVNPNLERPEVLVYINSKHLGWHWRRLPGFGARYYEVVTAARNELRVADA